MRHAPIYDWGEARARYDEGWSDGRIAKHLGCHQTTVIKWRRRSDLPPKISQSSPISEAERRLCRKMLRAGDSRKQIANLIGTSINTVGKERRKLGADPRLRRSGQNVSNAQVHVARNVESIMAELTRACRYISDPAIRDDVIGEMALDMLEDRLKPSEIKSKVRIYAGREFRKWASPFGPRSLDEEIGEDGLTLGMLIPCPQSISKLAELGQ